MDKEKAKHLENAFLYLIEMMDQLNDYAIDAEKAYYKNTSDKFRDGLDCAAKQIVAMFQNHAEVFGLSLEELHLDRVDPEKNVKLYRKGA